MTIAQQRVKSGIMNVFLASLLAETNSFAVCPTGYGAFEEQGIRRRTEDIADPMGILPAIEAVREAAVQQGVTLVEGLCAAAQPMGPVVHAAYIQLRDELLDGLKAALPVAGVFLMLHGAMTTDDIDDCEGDLLVAVRKVVGPAVPIGVSLDPHCHLTRQMGETTDIIVAYKEYPHTDIAETAVKTFNLMVAAARGEITPCLGVHDCRMMGLWPTTEGPMAGFVDRMRVCEAELGVLSVSLGHGMAYGDVAEAGSKLWVLTDGDKDRGHALARQLAHELYEIRESIGTHFTSLDEALDHLADWNGEHPMVLADVADNPGGGAMGDSTFVLRGLIDKGLERVALGGLWDPGAVQICREAGEGATFVMRLGGKTGGLSGSPVDVRATVMRVLDEHWQDDFGSRAALGPSAWVRTEGNIDIVLISRRQQVLGIDLFTSLGIDLRGLCGVAVKSMHHFKHSFGASIGTIVYVDTPGLMRTDFESIPFRHRSTDYWPRVQSRSLVL
ncbi:MAG: M81 family metallopeptidase [Sphingomonas sp.]